MYKAVRTPGGGDAYCDCIFNAFNLIESNVSVVLWVVEQEVFSPLWRLCLSLVNDVLHHLQRLFNLMNGPQNEEMEHLLMLERHREQ